MLTTLKYTNLLKKYFYKKYFIVFSDLQEMATVLYLCWGWEGIFKSQHSHLLCGRVYRQPQSAVYSSSVVCISHTNSSSPWATSLAAKESITTPPHRRWGLARLLGSGGKTRKGESALSCPPVVWGHDLQGHSPLHTPILAHREASA